MHQGSVQCYCRGLTEGIHQFPLLSVQLFCKCQTLRNANLADLFLASPSNGFFHQAADEGGPFVLIVHRSPFTFPLLWLATLGEVLSAHLGQHGGRNLPHLQPTGTEILFPRGWAPPAQKPHCSVASPSSQKPISCHDLMQGCSSSAPMSLHDWTGLQSAISMLRCKGVLVESQFHPLPSLSFLPWTFLEECWLVSHLHPCEPLLSWSLIVYVHCWSTVGFQPTGELVFTHGWPYSVFFMWLVSQRWVSREQRSQVHGLWSAAGYSECHTLELLQCPHSSFGNL